MATNRRERLLVMAALACLAIFAGDRFILEPLAAGWQARGARIAQLEQSLAAGETLLDRQDTIAERWTAMRERSLPADTADTESKVLAAVGRWAGASRLNVTSRKPRWFLDADGANQLEVRVSASGDLGAITRFLYELERDRLALQLEDVEIKARDDSGAQLTLETRFTGLVLPEVKP
jgi:hypothetical protein